MSTSLARGYFAAQAVAGAIWWMAVFASDDVRMRTLGDWSPRLLVVPDLILFVGASAMAAKRGGRLWSMIAAMWTTGLTVALTAYALVERTAGWGAVLMTLATVGSLASAATLWFGRLPTEWFFIGPFAFREAKQQTSVSYLRRSLRQVVVFWTGFLVVLPMVLAWAERRLRLTWPPLHQPGVWWVGVVTFVGGSGLGLWSCVSMALQGDGTPLPAATASKLVVVGPYRSVRNPMAVAGAIQTVGVGLWLGSWVVILSAFAGGVVWNTIIRPEEEADLLARFGEPYREYSATVRCWLP